MAKGPLLRPHLSPRTAALGLAVTSVGSGWGLSQVHLRQRLCTKRGSQASLWPFVHGASICSPVAAPSSLSSLARLAFPIKAFALTDTLQQSPIITSRGWLTQFALNLQAALCLALCPALCPALPTLLVQRLSRG